MRFNEVLNEIINIHSVRSVDICEKLNLNNPTILLFSYYSVKELIDAGVLEDITDKVLKGEIIIE